MGGSVERVRIGGTSALRDLPGPEVVRRPLPIVFLHGLWAGAWIFGAWLAPAAARGWVAFAPDLRGRSEGRDVGDLGRVGLGDFASDLARVLHDTGPAVVVGYSMGGLLTQMVMSDPDARDLVAAAVLLCSVPPRGVVAVSGSVLARAWRYLPALIAADPMLPTRADADAMLMNRLSIEDRNRWFPRFAADSGRAARQIAVGAVSVDPSAARAPVLVVSAEDDRISPPSIQPKLAARYGAERMVVPEHAHLVALERGWERTESDILDWAERTTTSSR
jgi:pimeloyl-ACP methyl ester carboxylesterase